MPVRGCIVSNEVNLKAILGEQVAQKPWQDWGVTTANGWAMSPDGTRVYHADTQAHTVYRYDFSEKLPVESALSHRQVFVQTVDTRQQVSKRTGIKAARWRSG